MNKRPIKFRLWCKNENRFLDNDIWFINHNGDIGRFDDDSPTNEVFQFQNPERYEIEQYIGLEDKNGNRIYEGDILKVTGDEYGNVHKWYKKGDVVYSVVDDYEYWIYWTQEAGLKEEWCQKNREVVGNIHENPELLKQ